MPAAKRKTSKRKARSKSKVEAQALAPTGFSGGGISSFDGTSDSPTRSFLTWAPVNTREEIDTFARVELSRRASILANKVPALRYLGETLSRHTTGQGIFPIATTRDFEWNVMMEDIFDNWFGNAITCDHKRRDSGYEMEQRIIPSLMRTGEFFALKARTPNGAPMIQTINPMNVATVNEKEGELIHDGVLLDEEDRRVGYRIALKDEKHRDVYAQSMCHVARIEREDQYRGITWAYTGNDPAHEILDTVAAAKAMKKLQLVFGMTITRPSGKADGSTKVGSGLRRVQTAEASASGIVEKQSSKVLEQFKGFGAIAYLQPGEELKLLTGPQGGETMQALVEYHLCELAWSWGISPDVLFFLSKLTGAPSRGAFDDYASFIKFLRDIITEKFLRPIWVWRAAVAMQRGEIRKCKDPRWWAMDSMGPPDITLDLGKTGKLSIDLLNAGLGTEADYWARLGRTWWRQQDQRIREIKRAMTRCEEEGVPYHYYRVMPQGTQIEDAAAVEDDDPPKDKTKEEDQ
jgi:capsid protein